MAKNKVGPVAVYMSKELLNGMLHCLDYLIAVDEQHGEWEKLAQRIKDAKDVKKVLEWCKANNAEFKTEIIKHSASLNPQKSAKLSDDVIFSKAESLVMNDEINVYIMNGTNEVDSSAYAQGSNIVIGGNTLGRGVTFPGLQTIYYTRTSKKPQADTMWQHSRMFGYDRDPGMMMIYIDEHLYKLFSDINSTNNSIIAQIERGIDDPESAKFD